MTQVKRAAPTKAFEVEVDDGTQYLMVCDAQELGSGKVLRKETDGLWTELSHVEGLPIMLIYLKYYLEHHP
jgi:hypothetical protein